MRTLLRERDVKVVNRESTVRRVRCCAPAVESLMARDLPARIDPQMDMRQVTRKLESPAESRTDFAD